MDKLDMVLEKLENMDEKINTMDGKINSMDEKINTMDKKINSMDERISVMDADVKSVKLTIENEIRTNIMRVAEGHLDLSRSLKEAVKSNNEFEMLTIKVNMLESDVRELKRKIS